MRGKDSQMAVPSGYPYLSYMRASPLHACATQWERSGHDNHKRSVEDQGEGCELGDACPPRDDFFCEDQGREQRHGRNIHHAQREEQHKEQPVTPQAVDTVLQAHAKSTRVTITPGMEDEIQRLQHFARQTRLRDVSW